jgi:hypothetical protein
VQEQAVSNFHRALYEFISPDPAHSNVPTAIAAE